MYKCELQCIRVNEDCSCCWLPQEHSCPKPDSPLHHAEFPEPTQRHADSLDQHHHGWAASSEVGTHFDMCPVKSFKHYVTVVLRVDSLRFERILSSVKRDSCNMRLGRPLCQSPAVIPPSYIQHAQNRRSALPAGKPLIPW